MAAFGHAYDALSTCRTVNGQIPWTAVDAYARRYEIEPFEHFEDVIYGCDRIQRAYQKMITPAASDDPGS